MDEGDIRDILQIILDSLSVKDFIWRVEGSANLKIQGVDVSIRDLDINTNDVGMEIFRDSLKEFFVKDFFNEKINGRSIICDINGFEVEINSYGDREKDMFDKNEQFSWGGLLVPILPLENAREFYRLIGRDEKVELISRYL